MSLKENFKIFRKIQKGTKLFFISIQKKIRKFDKDSNGDIKTNFYITKLSIMQNLLQVHF